MHGTIIIGCGQAGVQTAISLRAGGYTDAIRIIGQENVVPYQRPPLSKAFLTGAVEAAHLSLRPMNFYQGQNIGVHIGIAAERVDLGARRVMLTTTEVLTYEHLVLATGSRNRPLGLAGSDAANVLSLRTLADAEALKHAFSTAQKIVVIGGGFIGLEFAAVARKSGREVHIIEMQERLMARAVGTKVSAFYAQLHSVHGSHLHLGAGVASLHLQAGLVHEIELTDGTMLACDLLVYGVGAIANAELAREAGLEVGAGIRVNALMQTSDPSVLAVGDCAEHPNPFFQGGALIRLESVQNAVDQGKAAAAQILGQGVAYHVVPWFWSDQFDIKLQIAGLSSGADRQVVRGDIESAKFSIFYFRDDALIAVDSINMASDHMVARRLLAKGTLLNMAQVSDKNFDLRGLSG